MKKTSLLGLFCMLAILGFVLIGSPSAQGQESSATAASVSAINEPSGNALLADIDPNSAFGKLVRLVQAGVEEGVILMYIDNTLRLFELDADDIIYLTDLGTPAEVIKAAMEHDQRLIQKGISPQTATPESTPEEDVVEQPPEITSDDFNDTLTPYGVWVNIDGYGRCWRPTVAVYNTGWRPYCDNGRWVYTNHGWYWRSGYSWGQATFHYGRWFHHSRHGWCWWPDTVWAPSWVCWRYDRSYCGWAPLPPHTRYRSGVGFVYRNNRVGVGYDFGLNVNSFTFVTTENFCNPNPWRHRVDDGERLRIYKQTTGVHKIDYDQKYRRISNSGIPLHNITAVTRQEIRPVSIRHAQGGVPSGGHNEPDSPNSSSQRQVQNQRPVPTSQVKNPSKVNYAAQTPQRKPVPDSTPRPPKRDNNVTSQKNNSTASSRGQEQNQRPVPTPQVKKPSKANYTAQTPQRTPVPQTVPRTPKHDNNVSPQKNNSTASSRGQVQNPRPAPTPQVKKPSKVKTPSPAKPAKAKGKARNEDTGQ